MTSPPLSETGPSPEEQARAWIETQPHLATCWKVISGAPCDCREVRISMLADMLSAAKRSAHLQDARAGCVYCRGGWGLVQAIPTAEAYSGGNRWIHLNVNHPDDGEHCRRPEVWDALSLLGGKP